MTLAPASAAARVATPRAEAATDPARLRVVAIDAVRGLAIAIMLLNGNPGPRAGLPAQLKHPEWQALTFADLFFPLFLFAVGASMAFSSTATTLPKVLRRVVLLILIGLALTTVRTGEVVPQGVLQHIAGAYLVAWLVLKAPRRSQPVICGVALLAYWVAFLVFADGDPWRSGAGFAHTVNTWIFGSFRTEGVPQTVISSVNIVIGAWVARRYVEGERDRALLLRVVRWALVLIAAALVLTAVIPLNKRLWTPSFALLTAGTSCAWFALLFWLADLRKHRRLLRPLVVLGCNAIAVYVVFIGLSGPINRILGPFDGQDGVAIALVWAAAWMVLGWAFTHLLYRRRIFVKV
jgi:predicted acyltransferase